jgi:hypothetical protein
MGIPLVLDRRCTYIYLLHWLAVVSPSALLAGAVHAGPDVLSRGGLDIKAFHKALEKADLSAMVVEVPREW